MAEHGGPDGTRPSLWNNRGFRTYWSALAVSGAGSAVSIVVVPIIAAATLGASPAQMALLGAAGMLPGLFLQVPAAMWSDSIRSRLGIMAAAQVVLGALVALVPLLWWLGALTFERLLAIVAMKAVIGVCLAATSGPVVVELVPRDQLVAAGGRLSGTRSATDIAGQAAGGALLAVLAAPVILVADAVSFLVGAFLTRRIRPPADAAPPPAPRTRGRASVGEVVAIGRELATRRGVWCLTAIALVNGITEAVFVLFCLHALDMRESAIGLLLAVGAVGGVVGGFLVGRVAERMGRWTGAVGLLATLWSVAALPFVGPGWLGGAAVVNFELAGAFGGTIVIAAVFGSLQAEAAARGTVARTMALANNILQVAALAGLAVGGAVGAMAGERTALTVAAVVLACVTPPLLLGLRAPGRATATGETAAPDADADAGGPADAARPPEPAGSPTDAAPGREPDGPGRRLPETFHDQIVAADIDPRVSSSLTVAYYQALARRLVHEAERLGWAAPGSADPGDVRWLHPGAVWAARIAARDPALLDGQAVPVRAMLDEGRGPAPVLEHVGAGTAERWVGWGVENLASYAQRIDVDDRLRLAPVPLGDRRRHVDEALAVLADVWPEAAVEFHSYVRSIVHVQGAMFGSASFDEVFGAVFVGDRYLDTVPAAFEMVLHEGGHHALFLRARFEPFVTNGDEMAMHPLRDDPRPISGTLHAAYVLARMATGLARWRDGDPDAPAEVAERAEQCRADLCTTIAVLGDKAAWTDAGRAWFARLEDRAGALPVAVPS